MNKILYLFILSILALSCDKGPNPSNTPTISNGLMQLAVGNFWNYVKINYDSNTGLPIDTSSDRITILAQITVDTTTYFQQVQNSITNINSGSFFYNADSNTLRKIDSAINYVFFKRVSTDSVLIDSWPDTVSSHCKGVNLLYGFTDSTQVDGYNCLRNAVYVTDCTGFNFQTWVYYLKPGLGLVRIQHYGTKLDHSFYLDFQEDLLNYHIIP
jgi:hypothetical protein